jgi:hypothetical protein
MKNLTVIAVDFLYHDLTKYSVSQIVEKLDPKEVVIVSDKDFLPGSRFIYEKPVAGMYQYANFLLKNLWPLIETSHCLYVQWDSNIRDVNLWTDKFYDYDYIGAPWPWHNYKVGNGGFSLRSKKLLNACRANSVHLPSEGEEDAVAEDNVIGLSARNLLETRFDIRYPPLEIANQFSIEVDRERPTFGYHGVWNIFNYENDSTLDFFIPKIDYSRWNIHHCRHSLSALIKRGNNDYLNIIINKIQQHKPELASQLWRTA